MQELQIVPKSLMKQHGGDLLNDYTFPYHPLVLITILHLFTNPLKHTIWLTHFLCILEARAWIARSLLEKDGLFKLSNEEMDIICNLTEGIDIIPDNYSIFCIVVSFSSFSWFLLIYFTFTWLPFFKVIPDQTWKT